MVDGVLNRLDPWLESLPRQPLHRLDGGRRLARALEEDLPDDGTSFRRLLGQLFERVLPISLNTASPGYLGYIPGGGLLHAAVADLITNATNRYVGIWQAAPGLVQLETNVVRWFCALAGYPAAGSGGVLTSGGSIANLAAVVAARHDRLGEDFSRGVIFVSSQAHHSVRKAARIAGFPDASVREVAVDSQMRVRMDALAAAVTEARAAGLPPALVVATAGTTATGAVDPLPAIADLCQAERMWLHVDAAYGGFFLLTERGQAALRGIERSDSITLDPHKGLFLPYGTGCVLVRDLGTLRRAHQVSASYLPPAQDHDAHWDFSDLGPELSRDARGLRVWLPLKLHGARVFRAALDEKLDLAADAAARLGALPGVRLLAPPTLSLFAFQVGPAGVEDVATLDSYAHRLLARVNKRQRVFLTGATVEGCYVVRVCVLSFRTHADRIDALIEDVAHALTELGC